MRKLMPVVLIAGLGACGGGAELETGSPAPNVQPAPPLNADALPAGGLLTARMDHTVSTDDSKVGDAVSATVAMSIMAQNGETVVPAGARIRGTITGLDDSDHPADRALIRVDFNRLEMYGRSYPLTAEVESAALRVGDRTVHVQRGALAGAAAGAIAGAILRGVELDEILKGAAIGAGAGTVIGIVTGGDVEAELPAGSTITLRTTQQINLR